MSEATVKTPAKVLRAGSAPKRAAILAAARELFVAEGFERTSVDAVAARAGVSKRTVYDYFGDKRALLIAVVQQAAELLMTGLQAAVDEHLSPASASDLEHVLIAFADHIAVETIASSDYAALRRLVSMEVSRVPELGVYWLSSTPEEAIAERFAELGSQGLLHVPDARLAADHFIALAFSPYFDAMGQPHQAPGVTRRIHEGVRAFLRAYAAPA